MKAVHVIAPGGVGGAERVVAGGCAALRALGIDARVLILREERAPERAAPLAAEARACDVPVEAVSVRGRVDLTLAGRIRRSAEGADVLHVHGYKAAVYAALAPPEGAALVATHHGEGGTDRASDVYVRASLLAYRRAARVFAVSSATRDFLTERGVPADRIETLPNFLALDVDEAVDDPPAFDVTRLVYIGRLSPEKGVDVLLRALAWTSEPITLSVVGDGPERGYLERLSATLSLEERVRFEGFQTDVAARLGAAHALVLPSRSEGLPMTMVEAMAVGRPVIATAVGGVPEAHDPALGGALVAPEDPGALAAALDSFAHEAPARVAAAVAGASTVRDRFAASRWAEATAATYRDVRRGG